MWNILSWTSLYMLHNSCIICRSVTTSNLWGQFHLKKTLVMGLHWRVFFYCVLSSFQAYAWHLIRLRGFFYFLFFFFSFFSTYICSIRILTHVSFICQGIISFMSCYCFFGRFSMFLICPYLQVWKRFTQFEQTYGDLASMLKVVILLSVTLSNLWRWIFCMGQLHFAWFSYILLGMETAIPFRLISRHFYSFFSSNLLQPQTWKDKLDLLKVYQTLTCYWEAIKSIFLC